MSDATPELWDLDRIRRSAVSLPRLVGDVLLQFCDEHERLSKEYVRLAATHAALAASHAEFTKRYVAAPLSAIVPPCDRCGAAAHRPHGLACQS